MRRSLALVWLGCTLATCTVPPPEAYIGGQPTAKRGGIGVGVDAKGEKCTQLATGPGEVAIFCGDWQSPAARVQAKAEPSNRATLLQYAEKSDWRTELNLRYRCPAPPIVSTILDGEQAVVLSCYRRVGGWPEVGLVAAVDDKTYFAHGILPTLPVIQRSIGVLAKRVAPDAPALSRSEVDERMAQQIAANAFSAKSVDQYEQAMELGERANLEENFAVSETSYRSALETQEISLRKSKPDRDNPDTVNARMHLALALSNQHRFREAESQFQRAESVASNASDELAPVRLIHYRALDAINQRQDEKALKLLQTAGSGYAAALNSEREGARPILVNSRLLADPRLHSALLGQLEVQRYRAILLRDGGHLAESESAIANARNLAEKYALTLPLVDARITRTNGVIDVSSAGGPKALAQSASDFALVLPQTRPVAETALLQAEAAMRTNDIEAGLTFCRAGERILRILRTGVHPELIQPCLAAYAAAAQTHPTERQALFREMFEGAQLAQSSQSTRQLQEVAARLAARPEVGDAIRRREDAAEVLAELYRNRDLSMQGRVAGVAPAPGLPDDSAKLDRLIFDSQRELEEADRTLQQAAPAYGQLIQEVISAKSVFDALRPDEAYVDIVLSTKGGWVFALRNSEVSVAPVAATKEELANLVKRVRAAVEPTGDRPLLPEFDVGASYALYQAVLEPVAPQLAEASALVVTPTEPMLSIPFAMLLTGPANVHDLAHAPWLIRKLAVSHIPAPANFVTLRGIASGARGSQPWFGLGAPQTITPTVAKKSPVGSCARELPSLPSLPYAEKELVAARDAMGAAPQDLRTGTQFTTPAVQALSLNNYRIIHFATHAILPSADGCESEPAIVTSLPAGAADASAALLTAEVVTHMQLDANAVILSACNTGTTSGESLSVLARTFFYAGARAVLATHWALNDLSAKALVATTLQSLVADPKLGLAASLATSQRKLLDDAGSGASDPTRAHPFFWAPFALIGEGGSLTTTTNRPGRSLEIVERSP
jgi:CHAT domain-containing protein